MSLQTWKKEFYPVPANRVSQKNALAHSLKKWTGLQPSNLKKHSLEVAVDTLFDCKNDALDIDSSSCALCEHHSGPRWANACSTCPLPQKQCIDNYGEFLDSGNPKPMISLLRRFAKKAK